MLFEGKLRILGANDPNPYPDSIMIDCTKTAELEEGENGEAIITTARKRKRKTAIQLEVERLALKKA